MKVDSTEILDLEIWKCTLLNPQSKIVNSVKMASLFFAGFTDAASDQSLNTKHLYLKGRTKIHHFTFSFETKSFSKLEKNMEKFHLILI